MLQVSVVYAERERQKWLPLQVHSGCTVQQAIERSGILDYFPHIDLSKHRVGVHGKFSQLDSQLKQGDRVEIYQPITADPKTVPRRDN